MKRILLLCPKCSKKGYFDVSNLDTTKSSNAKGLYLINIDENIICKHAFVVYMDKNFSVRDYSIPDFSVRIPEIHLESTIEEEVFPEREFLDIDLIKINLSSTELAYILKSIFLKQKIVIISEENFLYDHYYNFFKYITKDTFITDILIMSKAEYKLNKKLYKESMVFNNYKIINNHKNLIKPKELTIEKEIISNFLMEFNDQKSFINLNSEIVKVYELSQKIADFLKRDEEGGKYSNTLKIIINIERVYGVKIKAEYIHFLVDVVKYYFEVEAPSLAKSILGVL